MINDVVNNFSYEIPLYSLVRVMVMNLIFIEKCCLIIFVKNCFDAELLTLIGDGCKNLITTRLYLKYL